MDPNANPDPIGALPPELADRLADVVYRAADAAARIAGLEQLVAAHPAHAAALRAAAAATPTAGSAADGPSLVGSAIGPFRVLGLLGRGGYGEVFLAEQSSPVRRRVALKVLKRGMDSAAILRRFAREQQALARMNHDGIARIFDAGAAPGGQPYFALELVEGRPLVAHCVEHGLGLRARVRLFLAVCRAVQHAHQKGILHRDLKSSNVLVARSGGIDTPKLIDFGIARALHDEGDDEGLTATGTLVGTVANMAPEQLLRAAGDVDTRTDVYALGLLLYEVLAGVAPLAATLAGARSPVELQRRVLGAEVGRPSAAAGAADRPEAAWRRQLVGDLDWIVLKATAREQERRYASAAELAQDLELHLAGMPVHAGPPGAGYRLGKLVRRHRGGVVAAALVLATAVVGAGWTVRFALLADERAVDNARLAAEAQAAAQQLATKVREFRQLAGVVKVAQAKAAEQPLYPAAPARIAALQAWLAGPAAELLALRADVAAALADLRRAALPWTADEQASDRAGHPQRGGLALAERRRDALRRQVALAAGGPLTVPELPAADAARASGELMTLARLRTGVPRLGRSIYGEEALGLTYARAAVAKVAGDDDGLDQQWALAWALAENGQDAEARALADVGLARGSKILDGEQLTAARLHADLHAAIAGRGEALAEAEAEVARLEALVSARQTWRFPPELQAEAFLHDTLVRLAADVDAFDALEVRNARARLRWALALRDDRLTAAHPAAGCTWEEVAAHLRASPVYRGVGAIAWSEALALDLVPLGPNPVTGLLEFYHLASAWDGEVDPRQLPIPRHAADGAIAVTSATGIVFALAPGGTVRLGSQADDPSAPFYDPAREPTETLHEVVLAPFLLARHELTQGQWRRLTAWSPDLRQPATYSRSGSVAGVNITDAHPVERVSVVQAELVLQRAGLHLPTEAQWEHACRAGSTTPWHAPEEELRHHANFADAATKTVAPTWTCLPWNDGHGVHAPVGAFRPNAWGFFDMHGNVAELTRDPDGPYGSERPGDGLRTQPGAFVRRFHRGGNWTSLPATARTAARMPTRLDGGEHTIGLRACRSLAP